MKRTLSFVALALIVSGCESPIDPVVEGGDMAIQTGVVAAGVVASASGSDISHREQGVRQLTFTAQMRADGTVTGHYNFTTEGTLRQLRGEVVCMRVSGDRVFVVGAVKHDRLTDFPYPVGGVAIEAVDGGPGNALDQISFLGLAPNTDVLMSWCESGAPGPVWPIEHGQIRVDG